MHLDKRGHRFKQQRHYTPFYCKKCKKIAHAYSFEEYYFEGSRPIWKYKGKRRKEYPTLAEVCACLVASRNQKPRHRKLYQEVLARQIKYGVIRDATPAVPQKSVSKSTSVARNGITPKETSAVRPKETSAVRPTGRTNIQQI